MGSEELEMAGGGPSQRVDIGLTSLSGRSVQSDQFSRSMSGPKRGEPIKKPRPGEGFGDYSDPQKFLGRERPGFLQSADRDYREGGEGFHLEHRVQKDSGDGDDRKNMYGGNQMPGLGMGRDQDWGGDRGVGAEGDYRDMAGVRGEVSEVSQSEGTEDDEDDADIEGEEGGVGDRNRQMVIVDRAIPHPQMTSLEGRIREDSMAPTRGVEGFQRPGSDRDRGMKAATSNSPSFGLYLQPSPQVTSLAFLNYGTSSPSGGQMATQVDANAPQNGGVGAGVGTGIPGPTYGMRDSYKGLVGRENSMGSSLHDQQSHGQLHESLQSSEENYYTSLLNSTGSNNNAPKGHELGNDVGSPDGLKRNSRMMDSSKPAERSLRSILSDPVSGQLMEDATIFACGHSFGSIGLQQVIASNVCITCGTAVRTTSMAANYALRAAVQAFKREEESLSVPKSVKRRRDRSEQDRGMAMVLHGDGQRPKGVQFPFAVSERVLIKGNKRTPERFVGREAVITNQCLNGWYLVRTSDNGESVRLQYRSLEKVGGQPSPNASQFGSAWL